MSESRPDILAEANRVLAVMEQVGEDFEDFTRKEFKSFIDTFAKHLNDFDKSEAAHKVVQVKTNESREQVQSYLKSVIKYAKARHDKHPSTLAAYVGYEAKTKKPGVTPKPATPAPKTTPGTTAAG